MPRPCVMGRMMTHAGGRRTNWPGRRRKNAGPPQVPALRFRPPARSRSRAPGDSRATSRGFLDALNHPHGSNHRSSSSNAAFERKYEQGTINGGRLCPGTVNNMCRPGPLAAPGYIKNSSRTAFLPRSGTRSQFLDVTRIQRPPDE